MRLVYLIKAATVVAVNRGMETQRVETFTGASTTRVVMDWKALKVARVRSLLAVSTFSNR